MKTLIKLFLSIILVVPVLAFSAAENEENFFEEDPPMNRERKDRGMFEEDDEFPFEADDIFAEEGYDTPEEIVQQLADRITIAFEIFNECQLENMQVPTRTLGSPVALLRTMSLTTPNVLVKECIYEHLETISSNICDSQHQLMQLKANFEKYHYRGHRLNKSIERVKLIEHVYKDRLSEMADQAQDFLENKHPVKGFARSLSQKNPREAFYYEHMLHKEAGRECPSPVLADDTNGGQNSDT